MVNSGEKIVVIGGGIAGLNTSLRLREAGLDVTLLELAPNVGGCIRSIKQDGYLLELGPNTFLNSSRALWELSERVGLKRSKISTEARTGKTRYIFRDSRLVRVPAGPNILFSNILSRKGRLRLLAEPFIKRRDPSDREESLAGFVARRFGKEALDYLATPFVSGIYAGDPQRLSLNAVFPKLARIEQEFGSILRGMKALKGEIRSSGLGSFRDGIAELPTAIEKKLGHSVIKGVKVQEIERVGNYFSVRFSQTADKISPHQTILAERVILAVPAFAASHLTKKISDELSHLLGSIEYAPITVVHTGHKLSDLRFVPDGFGYLVPRGEKVRSLGSLWSSTLFNNRAPKGFALFTHFTGGELDKPAMNLTNDELIAMVQKDLAHSMGIKNQPSFACITRYPRAIAQYNIGHSKKIARIGSIVDRIDRLHLTGSYFEGISVAATIEHSNQLADSIIR